MKKFALATLLACTLLPAASYGQVYVRVGPPDPIVEHYGPAPGRGYVWVAGYHRWDGRTYVWVPGRYEVPRRHYRVWVPGRWAHHRRGYYWVEGRWR